MKNAVLLIRIGGVINLLVGILHVSFWKLFDWSSELPKLSVMNSNIMQMLNLFTIVFFGYTSYVVLFKTKEVISSKMGQYFLGMLASMYAARLVMEFYFPARSLGFAAFLLFTTLLFAIPLLQLKGLRHAY